MSPRTAEHSLRIVVSGGPGGGKTTAVDMLSRELGDRVVVVPETATMLFNGGFPRVSTHDALVAAQTAIFHVQKNLEDLQAARYPGRILLCDRGTLDGAAYWPDNPEAFFTAMGTTLADQLRRYHHVIFFETAAVGGHSIASGNPQRIENDAQAVELDRKVRSLWSQHGSFHYIPHGPSFLAKITAGLHALTEILADGRGRPRSIAGS